MLQNFIQLFDTQTLLIFLATLFLVVWWSRSGDGAWKGGPPGPYALPILGNALQLIGQGQNDQYLVFEKFAKKYGNIFRLYLGPMRVVVVTGYDLIREGLVDKGASVIDRPNTIFLADKVFRQKGLVWSNGDIWKHSRRFALVSLRDFGVGKSSLEERIQDEAEIIMEGMESLNGRPFDPKQHMDDGVANIIFGIIRGSRYEATDPEFREALRLLEFVFKNVGFLLPENFAPWLRFLPLGTPGRKIIQTDAKLRAIMAREIETHRESFDPENIRDFIDLFLKMTAEEPTNSAFEEDNLFRMLIDLFLAGSESTATVLRWIMLYMIRFPEIQKLCQQEIEQVIGEGRKVCFKDKDSLPLCTATINEVLRIGNIGPTTVPHRAVEDTVLGGYNIPKGTMIMFSIYSAHHDPKYWKDSHSFDPMRWINEDGKFKKLEGFIPFGEGPRTCLGKSLSEMEMFLFFTNFIQRFTFKTVEGAPLPTLEGTQSGLTRMPQPYQLCAVRVS